MNPKEKNILTWAVVALVVTGLYIAYKKNNATTTTVPPVRKPGANMDGSAKTTVVSPAGVASTVVDSAGDYIENSDPTTLYNKSGNIIGNLNPSYGMFTDSNGNIIAASDGTPVTVNIANGTYTEPDGTVYNMDGTIYTAPAAGSSWWDYFNVL